MTASNPLLALFKAFLKHRALWITPTVVMTAAARPTLRGDASVTLRRDTITSASAPVARALVSDEDAPLLAALKAKRRELAEAARVPSYVVFNDKTLIEMAQHRPRTLDDMAGINGVGQKKLDRYGDTFLAVINGEDAPLLHPARRKLAGQAAGSVYDRLLEAQATLQRGSDGLEKPLTCSAALLARVAGLGACDPAKLTTVLGKKRAERFGAAFLDILRDAA